MPSDALEDRRVNIDLGISARPVGSTIAYTMPSDASNGNMTQIESSIAHAVPAGDILYRVRDIVLGGLILVLLSPVLLIIAVAIRLESPGPVLFRQQRGGLHGNPFTCLKFRSMRVLEDGDDVRSAARGDDRVTVVGRYLRRASLDELPQLINVVRGDMSLVGPRPHAVKHDRLYDRKFANYKLRFNVRPGMTGLAQILDLRGGIDSDVAIASRIAADLNYIDRRSMILDFVIMVMTPVMLIFCRSAY